MRNLRFGFILFLALGFFGFANKAQAQTVLVDQISLPQTRLVTINNNYNPEIGRFQAGTQSTITQVIYEISDFATPNNIETLLSQSTLTVGGTPFDFASYDAATRRATFTGSVALAANQTFSIYLRCTSCGFGSYHIVVVQGTGTGWADLSGHPTRIQLSGTSPNAAPQLTAIEDRSDREDFDTTLTPQASDANNDTLSWAAYSLPTGLSIDAATGVISGTAEVEGTYEVTVVVDDGNGGSDSSNFTWQIIANQAPALQSIAAQTASVGDAVSLTIEATDAEGDAISYSVNGLPDGLSLDAATGIISGTPNAVGSHQVTVTAEDILDASSSESFVWTIMEAPTPAGSGQPDTPQAAPEDFSIRAPLAETSVQNVLRDLPHRLAPSLRLTLNNGLTRLAQLRTRTPQQTQNTSRHNIQARFADSTANQIAHAGVTRLANAGAEAALDAILPDSVAIWSQGEIAIGSLKANTGRKLNVKLANLALGIDRRVTPQLTLGAYVQTSNDKGGTALFDNTLSLANVLGYASYVSERNRFAQIALGAGSGKVDMNRNTDDTLYGARSDASQAHFLISLGQQWDLPRGQLAVALDLAQQEANLEAYEEVGEDGAYGYQAQHITTRFIGLNGQWQHRFATKTGTAQGYVKFGYQADVSDTETAHAYALDDRTTLYHFSVTADDNTSLSHGTLAFGGALQSVGGWQLNGALAADVYDAGTIGRLSLTVARRF